MPIYGIPVTSGSCSLRLDKPPANDVIIAVICNTDYVYEGEQTRKVHYDYRLQLGEGVVAAADIYTKWYDVDLSQSSQDHAVAVGQSSLRREERRRERREGRRGEVQAGTGAMRILSGNGSSAVVQYTLRSAGNVSIAMYSLRGTLVKRLSTGYRKAGKHSRTVDFNQMGISAGTYIVRLSTAEGPFLGKVGVLK